MLTTLLIHTDDESTDTSNQVIIFVDRAFTSRSTLPRFLMLRLVGLADCQLLTMLISEQTPDSPGHLGRLCESGSRRSCIPGESCSYGGGIGRDVYSF